MRAWMICCLLALLVACSDDAETTSDINLDTSADASADTTPNDIASTTDAAVDTPSAPAVDPCEDMGPDAVNAGTICFGSLPAENLAITSGEPWQHTMRVEAAVNELQIRTWVNAAPFTVEVGSDDEGWDRISGVGSDGALIDLPIGEVIELRLTYDGSPITECPAETSWLEITQYIRGSNPPARCIEFGMLVVVGAQTVNSLRFYETVDLM